MSKKRKETGKIEGKKGMSKKWKESKKVRGEG